MAKCPVGHHDNCSGCGEFVNPNRDHQHHYHSYRGGVTDILCYDCSLTTAAAAGILLKALDSAGIHPSSRELIQMMLDRRFLIGVQARFDELGART